jgi:hypothetical protein
MNTGFKITAQQMTPAQRKLARAFLGSYATMFMCIHGHGHRTRQSMQACEDGSSGAATGSRAALR